MGLRARTDMDPLSLVIPLLLAGQYPPPATELAAARADALACALVADSHPAIPRLPLARDQEVPARFHPRIAASLFAEFHARAAASAPDQAAALRADYSRYAVELVRVWTAATDPPISRALWPEYRTALTFLKPAELNRDHRTILIWADAALATVPVELDEHNAASEGRLTIARELAALSAPWFDDACRRARDKWVALGPSAAAARDTLTALAVATFEADYLEVSGGASTRYWSSLLLGAASAIAEAAPASTESASLLADARAFPIALNSTRALSPAQVQRLAQRTAHLIRTGLSASSPDGSATIGRGGRTSDQRMNDQLARLAGETAFDDEARDRWAYQFRAVLGFLSPDLPQSCEMVPLGPEHQLPHEGADPVARLLPIVTLRLGDEAPITITGRSPVIPFPGPPVTFSFSTGGSVTLPAPWNVATLLAEGRVDDRADPTGRLVIAPVVFEDESGQRLCYWIGLRFERPPPALAEWPDASIWPD